MMRRLLRLVLSAGLVSAAGLVAVEAEVEAGPPPGMPDPATMSGIPRPEPNLSPGSVTVRCLRGSFANPAIGVEVELEIASADGPISRKATSADKGRALFAGLEDFLGSSVIAKATIAGQELRSQSFVLGPESGIALLLVATEGAAPAGVGPAASPTPADPHGGQGAVPVPGEPFPLVGRPPGTLVVGALDLGTPDPHREGAQTEVGPLPGVEVVLLATAPDLAEPIRETMSTDAEGRAVFEGLDQRLPEGATIIVEAVLEDGGEPERSISFTLGDSAYAVILTRGERGPSAAGQGPGHGQAQPLGRSALPGPRVDRGLQPGQVRVVVLDAHDEPVANQPVIVHSSQATGGASNHTGTTDAEGMVIVEGVPVESETLSQVRVVYEGAPYSSSMFGMPEDTGAIAMLRVFRPTADRSRIRSVVQIDVSPRENDFAAINFNYALFVDGDEAFWVPGGMTIYAPPGTQSLHLMEESKAYLVHDGEAPWFELDRPLVPGEELRLSFAVGIEHDGSLELEWTTPFPLVEEGSLVSVSEELAVTSGVGGAPEVNPHGVKLYKIGYQPFTLGVCDLFARSAQPCPIGTWSGNELSVTIEGLRTSDPVGRYAAWALLGFVGLGLLVSMALRRRVGTREALLARRDALMAGLVALDERDEDTDELREARTRIIRALDRIYGQLEALSGEAGQAG